MFILCCHDDQSVYQHLGTSWDCGASWSQRAGWKQGETGEGNDGWGFDFFGSSTKGITGDLGDPGPPGPPGILVGKRQIECDPPILLLV